MQSDKYRIIGEHKIVLPELPDSRKIILFNEQKKENQFWDREKLISEYRQIWFDFLPFSSRSPVYTKMYQSATLYDQDGLLISLNQDDSKYIERIYLQEKNRRLNGVWFFNDEEPTWITGGHYFFLMWARMQRHDGMGLFADYREFQADYFRLLHYCRISPHILGLFCSKPKKTGITNAHWSGHYLNRSTLYANKNLGYSNINLNQAAKTFNDYFMYSLNGLVSPLKPEIKLVSLVDGTIVFGQSYNGSKKIRKPNSENEDDLNSSVMCVPTKAKAFDVAVMDEIAIDEPTKQKESFAEFWRTNKESIKIQSKINGKACLFNYTEGDDTQSFREARDVFLDSGLKTITTTSNGQTKSGLIKWHIPAYAAWEGAFDKNGRCEQKRAAIEIEQERSKVKGEKRALQAITRQYANNEREAWGSAGAGSTFDNIRLGDLLADIEIDQHDNPDMDYKPGKLEWENPMWEIGLRNKRQKGQFCPVKYIPLSERDLEEGKSGKCRFYKMLSANQANYALKWGRDENNCLLPPPRFYFVGGFDPTSYAAGSEVIEGSKNGGYVMNLPDEKEDSFYKKVVTNIIVCEYYDRAELPDEAFEDFLKMIIYYGSAVIIEGNASYVATRMLEEGLGHYCFVRDENGIIRRWQRYMGLATEPDKLYQLVRTTANSAASRDMLETLIRLIKNYIEQPEAGVKDYGATIKSEKLLKQLMDFNPEDTKKYDLVMSFGYCLLARELYLDSLMSSDNNMMNDANIATVLRALAS